MNTQIFHLIKFVTKCHKMSLTFLWRTFCLCFLQKFFFNSKDTHKALFQEVYGRLTINSFEITDIDDFYFSNIAIAILDFSLLLLVKLSLLILLNPIWYQFFASFLMALSPKLSLFQLSLLKAIAKRLLFLFANAFKSVKERQLLLSQQLEERKLYGKQYRKEAMNLSTKLIQKLKQRD